jgi:predicted ester cyclase
VVLTIVGGEETVGLESVVAMINAIHFVLFDSHPELRTLVIGEGQVALEADFVATHTGEFAGIAPTGAAVDVPYSVFYELEDDLITELRVYGLVDGLVQQLQVATGGE